MRLAELCIIEPGGWSCVALQLASLSQFPRTTPPWDVCALLLLMLWVTSTTHPCLQKAVSRSIVGSFENNQPEVVWGMWQCIRDMARPR